MMSKSINVEAQRVSKILNETLGNNTYSIPPNHITDKLKVLSLLNMDLFEEVIKKDEEDLGKQIHYKKRISKPLL